MAITVSIYVTGVAATYFLEGRIHLVDRLLVLLVNDIEFNPAEGVLYISHTQRRCFNRQSSKWSHKEYYRGIVKYRCPS